MHRHSIDDYKVLTAMRPEKAPAIEYIPLFFVSAVTLSLESERTRTVQGEILDDIWDTKSRDRTSMELARNNQRGACQTYEDTRHEPSFSSSKK